MKALTPVLLFVVASRSLPAMGAEQTITANNLESNGESADTAVVLGDTVKFICNGGKAANSVPDNFSTNVCVGTTKCSDNGVTWASLFPGLSGSPVSGDCFDATGCTINIPAENRADTAKTVNLACGKNNTNYYVAKMTFAAKATTAAPPTGGNTSSSTAATGGSGTSPTTAAPGGSTTTTTSGSSFFSLGVASVTLAISTFLLL